MFSSFFSHNKTFPKNTKTMYMYQLLTEYNFISNYNFFSKRKKLYFSALECVK